jgi:hypothetical protein
MKAMHIILTDKFWMKIGVTLSPSFRKMRERRCGHLGFRWFTFRWVGRL